MMEYYFKTDHYHFLSYNHHPFSLQSSYLTVTSHCKCENPLKKQNCLLLLFSNRIKRAPATGVYSIEIQSRNLE